MVRTFPIPAGESPGIRLLWVAALGLMFLGFWFFVQSRAQSSKPLVYVVPIEGVIDLGLAPFVRRVLDEADAANADAVILEVNTFGGRVDAAVQIRDALLQARVSTIAFVNKRAISAGALITLAAETIAMTGGATMGAAMPVKPGGPGGGMTAVGEKTVSYVRKEFRATAEHRNRPTLLVEAMVDADVAIPGVVERGKLLTLTTVEALRHHLADLRADSFDALLEAKHLEGAEIRRMSPNWAETLVRFLTDPIVSSLLMSLGILGIMVEIRMPGFGIPGIVGLTSLGLFFWGHWLVRLAGWEELLLFGIGILLLAIEVFVTPGFGIPGILGLIALLAGFTLSLTGSGASWPSIMTATSRVALSIVVALGTGILVLRWLGHSPFGRMFVLGSSLPAGAGQTAPPETDQDHRWLGKRGTVISPLRPSGIARFDGERVDVISEGGYIEIGQRVEVVRVAGSHVVVRSVPDEEERSDS